MRLPIRCLSIAACVMGLSGMGLAEQVDNPAYLSWSKYKPGTSVTYKQENTIGMPGGMAPKTEMTVVQKLLDVKPDAVSVQVNATMSMGGQQHTLPEHTMSIPAKIDKDMVGIPQQPNGEKPEIKDMKEGKETIDVNGISTETKTREYTVTVQQPRPMTMHVKTWFTTAVPGGIVKSETTGEGSMPIHSTMSLADYHIEK